SDAHESVDRTLRIGGGRGASEAEERVERARVERRRGAVQVARFVAFALALRMLRLRDEQGGAGARVAPAFGRRCEGAQGVRGAALGEACFGQQTARRERTGGELDRPCGRSLGGGRIGQPAEMQLREVRERERALLRREL